MPARPHRPTHCTHSAQGILEVRDAGFLHGYSEPVLLVLHEPEQTWVGRCGADLVGKVWSRPGWAGSEQTWVGRCGADLGGKVRSGPGWEGVEQTWVGRCGADLGGKVRSRFWWEGAHMPLCVAALDPGMRDFDAWHECMWGLGSGCASRFDVLLPQAPRPGGHSTPQQILHTPLSSLHTCSSLSHQDILPTPGRRPPGRLVGRRLRRPVMTWPHLHTHLHPRCPNV
eukprot:363974-Chlamydomonas_euryale.AAC.4